MGFRPLAPKLPWPDVHGKRCLDIGTADGFWAFELDRRGAADVVAIDRPSYFQSKCRVRFQEAHAKLGSRVTYEERDLYDLEGEFDFAFMGYVLQVVTDPLGALEAVRRVCPELLVLDTVSVPLSFLPSPLARLDARRDGGEWFVFNPAGVAEGVRARRLDGAGADGNPRRQDGARLEAPCRPAGPRVCNPRDGMRLDGIHHVTCITGDAPGNVDFYTRVLGLRLVKKSVNQDDPTVYHLFYADEDGHAGSDITFFEYPNARPGQAGDGMVHTVVWRVASADALEFWADRLSAEGHEVEPDGESLRFANPEGLAHELIVSQVDDEPLVARHPEIPREVALQGFEGVRAYGRTSDEFLTRLGFAQQGGRWESRADSRGGWIEYGDAPDAPGVGGAGTVHHVAWASKMEDQQAWHDLVAEAGGRPTQIIDRFWFRSIYFREPAGVLFEIATLGPGFATDEDPAHLGEKLILPPAFEHLRERVEPLLTPLPDPRADWSRA